MFIDERDLIGQTIKNTYIIDKIIGRGNMGVVYLAHDTTPLAVPIALKVLLPKEASEANTPMHNNLLDRFRRECFLIAQLRHSHIVTVYDTGEYEGMAYLVMQYLEGGTLHDKIQRQQALSLDEALGYTKQAASALECVHFKNAVHRDVKPQNFLLDNQEQLFLSDFGVAHIVGSTLTQPGQFLGSMAYASPQLKRGEEADPRDDIYSLAVVLYEMLTGNHPAMVNQPHPNVPPRVATVIQKATATRREDRYTSVMDMAQAVELAIKGVDEAAWELSSSPEDDIPEDSPTEDATVQDTGPSALKAPFVDSIPRFWQFAADKIALADAKTSPRTLLDRLNSFPAKLFSVLALFIVVAILLSFIILRSQTSMTLIALPSTSSISIGDVTEVVQQYYSYWNKENYLGAYNLLQSDYKHSHPFATLLPDYKHTHYACVAIETVVLTGDETAQVTVTDNAIEDASSGTGTINRYTLVYIVSQEQGVWKLTPTNLQLESTHGVCQAP